MLDVGELTLEQRDNLLHHLSAKFNAGINEVSEFVLDKGLPIPVEETSITIHNPMKWFDVYDLEPDDFDEGEFE
jgi:hypothetical protein